MTKITTFTETSADELRDQALEALKKVAADFGLVIEQVGRGSYNFDAFSMKVKFTTTALAEAPKENRFIADCAKVSLHPSQLNATFVDGRYTFQIVDIDLRKRVRPVICKRNDGKEFIYPPKCIWEMHTAGKLKLVGDEKVELKPTYSNDELEVARKRNEESYVKYGNKPDDMVFYCYTRRQMTDAFEKVKPKQHWKGEINAIAECVDQSEANMIVSAIAFFCGDGGTSQHLNGNLWQFKAPGYWKSIGA